MYSQFNLWYLQLQHLLNSLPISRMVSFGLEDFAEKYGVLEPSQFVDVMSLVGDKSDNIPGDS